MDSQDPTIEEKLVPFVEGALAEADRREVLQALPNHPALNQEVRQLREAILALRSQAARGLSYQSPIEAPPEQVVDFALQGEQWSRQSSRQFQLHLLESNSIADELSILRELEQDLQQRVEPSKTVPEMPAALRLAIQETYGKPPADPAWKRAAAAIVAWTAGLNLKVASAALAGCVLVVGAVSVGRYAHERMETSSTTVAVSTSAPAATSPELAAAATPEAAPAGQVALLQEKVLPEDLPGLSRRLWTKQVSHSYREGQIYVAQADFDKAWSALQMNNEKIATAKPLKTGGIASAEDKPTNLLDGVIGQIPSLGDRKEPKPKPKQPQGRASSAVADATALPGRMTGGVPDPVKAVAVDLPPAPEVSQGGYAPPPPPTSPPVVRSKDFEDKPVVVQEEHLSVPAATRPSVQAPVRRSAPTRVAAPARQDSARPSQMAYERVPGETSVKGGEEGAVSSAPKSKNSQVFQPKNRKETREQTKPSQAPPIPADPAVEAQAPAIEPLQRPSAAPPRVNAAVTPLRQQKAPVAVAPPATVNLPVTAPASNANLEPVTEEDATPPPAPAQVAIEAKKAENVRDRSESENGPQSNRSDDSPGRPLAKQVYLENAGASRVNMGASSSRAGLGKVQDESFQVQAGAPFEVAMLPVAKKLVEDLVGESKVQMERKEDGHLLVTIRPARSLSPQEVDKLRKVVREKLELKDEDTVVIRQP